MTQPTYTAHQIERAFFILQIDQQKKRTDIRAQISAMFGTLDEQRREEDLKLKREYAKAYARKKKAKK